MKRGPKVTPRFRVRLSAKGRKVFPIYPGREGTCRQRPGATYISVMWDGTKSWQQFHPAYLEKTDDGMVNEPEGPAVQLPGVQCDTG